MMGTGNASSSTPWPISSSTQMAPNSSTSTLSSLNSSALSESNSTQLSPPASSTNGSVAGDDDFWSIYREWSESILSQLGLSGAGILGVNGTGLTSDFNCSHHKNGYFADVGRDCRVFYFCYRTRDGLFGAIGDVDYYEKITLICDKGMQFDQRTLSCTPSASAFDCKQSPQLFNSSNSLNGEATTSEAPFSLFSLPVAAPSNQTTAPANGSFISQVFGG